MSKTLRTAAFIVGAVALAATGIGAVAGAVALPAATGATAGAFGISAATLSTIGTIASVASSVLAIGAGLAPKRPTDRTTTFITGSAYA